MSSTILEAAKASGAHTLPNRNGSGFSTLVNECPVDLVTNRILAHTAHGTQGLVHAVVSGNNQLKFGDYWNEYLSTVPYALRPEIEWVSDAALLAQFHARATGSTKDEFLDVQFSPLSREFAFLGASYMFGDRKTKQLWEEMGEAEKEILPLLIDGRGELECALKTRKKRSTAVIGRQLTKYGFFSTPEGGLGALDGHQEAGFLTGANGVEAHLRGNTTVAIADVTNTNQAVGQHRFPQPLDVLGTAVGTHVEVVARDIGGLIEGVKRAVADAMTRRQGKLQAHEPGTAGGQGYKLLNPVSEGVDRDQVAGA